MKRSTITKLLAILALSSLSYSVAAAKTIRVFGTDLFTSWLPDYYNTTVLSEELSISFSLSGSYGGLIALQKNYADGVLYLQSEEAPPEIPEGFEMAKLGYLVIYLYAPDSFPQSEISKLTLSKIANISESDTTITWEALLADPGSWGHQSTKILVDTGADDILWSLYRLNFIQSDTISDRITLTRSEQALKESLLENDFFVLATNRAESPSESLKTLALTDFEESVAFPPTQENIHYGDYSARFPIYLIYPTKASWTKDLLDLFQSKNFKEALTEHRILPNQ